MFIAIGKLVAQSAYRFANPRTASRVIFSFSNENRISHNVNIYVLACRAFNFISYVYEIVMYPQEQNSVFSNNRRLFKCVCVCVCVLHVYVQMCGSLISPVHDICHESQTYAYHYHCNSRAKGIQSSIYNELVIAYYISIGIQSQGQFLSFVKKQFTASASNFSVFLFSG